LNLNPREVELTIRDKKIETPRHLLKAESVLRGFALTFPETVEEFPWGHRAMKVKKKTFLFMAVEGDTFSLSVKLPQSNLAALLFPHVSPTDYGLGKSGWVTARYQGQEKVDVDLLKEWIDESYRAIAPKRLVAFLEGVAGAEKARPAKKRPQKRK
jgi:predicted DNA-binding protein (MmcQ/YjbR family)